MNKKLVHYLAGGFLGLTAVLTFNQQVHTVQAKIPSTIRTVMYTSQAYDEDGRKVEAKYPAFHQVKVEKKPLILTFKPYAPYYKISGKKSNISKLITSMALNARSNITLMFMLQVHAGLTIV